MARPAGELCHLGFSHPSRSPISGVFLHQRDASEAGAGPTAPQETLNHATPICSSSDNLLYVTYPHNSKIMLKMYMNFKIDN